MAIRFPSSTATTAAKSLDAAKSLPSASYWRVSVATMDAATMIHLWDSSASDPCPFLYRDLSHSPSCSSKAATSYTAKEVAAKDSDMTTVVCSY